MAIKFVLFDMDGTITDTMRLQPWLIKHVLLKNSKSMSFREVQRKMASIYYRNNFSWFRPKTPIFFSQVFKISIFRMFFLTPIMILLYWRALQQERIFKETEEVIKSLKNNNIIVGLATNGTDFEVKVKIPSITHLFEIKVTSSDVTKKKPNPEMILTGIKKANVKPDETLYVGDTIVDFLASTNAKTDFALMSTGTFGPDAVKISTNKPKNIFNNLKELENYILANK